MAAPAFKHIYGPVYSWRMGLSLGIDPLSVDTKYCNFACPYCQLGAAGGHGVERRVFISPAELAAEIRALPAGTVIDYLTFSGKGEPTLAANLGELIRAARMARPDKVAVITNAAMIMHQDVQADLILADLVLVKMDAADEAVFRKVNSPAPGITWAMVVAGIKAFRGLYKGKLALQMMFVQDNQAQAPSLARIAREIGADEIQLNTPLRSSPVRALNEAEMRKIKEVFMDAGLNARSVYDEEKKGYRPFDDGATAKRHGVA